MNKANILKRINSLGIALILTAGCTLPVFADTQEITGGGTKDVDITYNKASSFTVTIPKTIELSHDSKTTLYEVAVNVDLVNTDYITIAVNDNVQMTDKNDKTPVQINVALENKKIKTGQTVLNGEINADDISAGNWHGKLTFDIAVKQFEIECNYTTTSGIESVDKASGDIVIPEYITDSEGNRCLVTSISANFKTNCGLITTVTLPNSLKTIGAFGLYGTGQKYIYNGQTYNMLTDEGKSSLYDALINNGVVLGQSALGIIK